MTNTSKREELIEEAAKALYKSQWHDGDFERTAEFNKDAWRMHARAALAVFDQAHTPTNTRTDTTGHRELRECTICGEKVTASNASEAWEKRHEHLTPTDDASEREEIARIIDGHIEVPVSSRLAIARSLQGNGFRRTAVQEPSADLCEWCDMTARGNAVWQGHDRPRRSCGEESHGLFFEPDPEPQDEPSAKFIPGSNGAITVPQGEPTDAQVAAALDAFYGTKKAAHMWDRREDMRAALTAAYETKGEGR